MLFVEKFKKYTIPRGFGAPGGEREPTGVKDVKWTKNKGALNFPAPGTEMSGSKSSSPDDSWKVRS